MLKVLTTTIAVLIALYVAAVAAMFAFQRNLLFLADGTLSKPSEAGLENADVQAITTSDGVKLVAWLARGDGERLAIYFHGNGGALTWRGPTIESLRGLGLSVLAIDYRGFGGSEGSPSEEGLARDADAAYAYARQLGYAPSQIMLFGESLGSGVAISLATRSEVAGLILDSAYSSIADVASDRYWMFPVRLLIRDPFQSDRLIGRIASPILLIHGTADDVVPFKFGQKLFAAAGRNAAFVTVEGAGHLVLDQAAPAVGAWMSRIP